MFVHPRISATLFVLGAALTANWVEARDDVHPAFRSEVTFNGTSEVFHLYPYPYKSLIDAKDHLRIPAPGPDGISEISAIDEPPNQDPSAILGDRCRNLDLASRAKFIETLVDSGTTMTPSVLKLVQDRALTPCPLLKRERASESDHDLVVTHGLRSVLSASLRRADVLPFDWDTSPDQPYELDDSYLTAVVFLADDNALVKKLQKVFPEYSTTVCLTERQEGGCEDAGASSFAKEMLRVRSLKDPQLSLAPTAPEALQRLQTLDAALAYDLSRGRISGIRLIYSIPYFSEYSFTNAPKFERKLLEVRSGMQQKRESELALGMKLGLVLGASGVDEESVGHLVERFKSANGALDLLNRPLEFYRFMAEKVEYLAYLNAMESHPDELSRMPIAYRSLKVTKRLPFAAGAVGGGTR